MTEGNEESPPDKADLTPSSAASVQLGATGANPTAGVAATIVLPDIQGWWDVCGDAYFSGAKMKTS